MPNRQPIDLADPANHILFLDRMGRDVLQLKDEAAKESAHTRTEFSEMRQQLAAISEKLTPIQILSQDVRHLQDNMTGVQGRIETMRGDIDGVGGKVRAARAWALGAALLVPVTASILVYAYRGDRATTLADAKAEAANTVISAGTKDREKLDAQEDKLQRVEIWAAGQQPNPYRR